MSYDSFVARRAQLETQIKDLRQQISSFPEGKLVCTKNGKYFKWFRRLDGEQIYISKYEREDAQQLAVKGYLEAQLNELVLEQKAIDYYLKLHKFPGDYPTHLLTEPSGFQELLRDIYIPSSEKFSSWEQEPFQTNPYFREKCTLKTLSGRIVRSKSESMIDMLLTRYEIPHRYECELILGNRTIYPDFTILHPKTEQLFYWEHFGLMDDPDYTYKIPGKLYDYAQAGIYPGQNLILTYESGSNPLDFDTIDQTIRQFLL